MTIHEIAIVWTARGAVACMLVRVLLALGRRENGPTRRECTVWMTGCILFLLHVWAAFQFRHGWSHTDAYRHTAEQTAAVTGWSWGGGLYLNYLFTALWVIDVVVDWRAYSTGISAHTRWRTGLHLFLAFIVVNATLVFGHPGWWVVAGLMAWAVFYARRSQKRQLHR